VQLPVNHCAYVYDVFCENAQAALVKLHGNSAEIEKVTRRLEEIRGLMRDLPMSTVEEKVKTGRHIEELRRGIRELSTIDAEDREFAERMCDVLLCILCGARLSTEMSTALRAHARERKLTTSSRRPPK
jgi:hypothetical protein